MTQEKKQSQSCASKLIVFLIFLIPHGLLPSYAFSKENLHIEPVIAHNFGSAWFRMQVTEPITDPGNNFDFTQAVGQSELEYPLDVMIGGLKTSKDFNIGTTHPLKMKFYLWKNINNPTNKMQDSDWFGAKNSTVTSLYKFSYTQSTSIMDWAGGEIELESDNHTLFNRKATYGVRVSGDYSSHKMYGVTGWQKLPDTERIEFDIFKDQLVLTYKLFHIEPSIYTTININHSARSIWQTTFSASPLVLAKDKDDHVLRNKNSETTAYGFSIGFRNHTKHFIEKQLALTTSIEIHYYRTEGDMNQRFYGDDPGTVDDETGLEFRNINNVISMFTQKISVGLQYSF